MANIEQNSLNSIIKASSWIEGALTGKIATIIAMLAIASIGLLMLRGRVGVHRSVQVILGCFIIFGASTIAMEVRSALTARDSSPAIAEIDPPPYFPAVAPPVSYSVTGGTDPYAGAAVPRR